MSYINYRFLALTDLYSIAGNDTHLYLLISLLRPPQSVIKTRRTDVFMLTH